MKREDILNEMIAEFRGGGRRTARKYVGGLLPAFCMFMLELEAPKKKYKSLAAFFEAYPQITEGISTLTVRLPEGGQKTIRPAYEKVHAFYINKHNRLDYPRSAPYATGKWGDYRHWLEALLHLSEADLKWIVDGSTAFVLKELKDQSFDPSTVKPEPPLFRLLLEGFDFAARAQGEPTGAAFQAMVFGYIRADAPHLQVEARKARAGSARTQGIGDIDSWEGDRLIISAEVKHYIVSEKNVDDFTHFAAAVNKRAALGLIIAIDFQEGVRERIEALGLHPLSTSDLLGIVTLWDPLKQRAAAKAFQWVVVHKEQNSGLIERVHEFFGSIENN